ncbi:uncharacterized protein LOC111041068 [Myzus persicae]|uniref:uncharacterized protein LOC111041068 n=1 Tax=Myzus persicae TaxID=13164 RepID=UPI000B9353E3|nr:uncharacterized protein LOC111041068 [Myzus persicae]
MEKNSNHDESRPGATLPGVVGHQETAVGGGSPQRSISTSQIPNEGVSSMALSSGKNTTAETVVPSGTQRKPGPIGDKERPTASSQKRVIDISALDEDELLGMLRGYINSMCAFVKSNRNVHKELKETLANSRVVLTQYTKVKNRTPSTGTRSNVCKSQHTQTGVATKDATTNTDAPACEPPPPKPQLAGVKRKQQQPQQNQPGQRLGLQATGRKEKKNRRNKEQHQQQQQHRVEPVQPSQEADHDQQQQLTWSQVARRTKKSKKEDPPPQKRCNPRLRRDLPYYSAGSQKRRQSPSIALSTTVH